MPDIRTSRRGALRRYVHRHYGADGFTRSTATGRGIIRRSVLLDIRDTARRNGNERLRAMAQYALNARRTPRKPRRRP